MACSTASPAAPATDICWVVSPGASKPSLAFQVAALPYKWGVPSLSVVLDPKQLNTYLCSGTAPKGTVLELNPSSEIRPFLRDHCDKTEHVFRSARVTQVRLVEAVHEVDAAAGRVNSLLKVVLNGVSVCVATGCYAPWSLAAVMLALRRFSLSSEAVRSLEKQVDDLLATASA